MIQVETGKQRWLAKPRPSGTTSVGRVLSALFSTDYEMFPEATPEKRDADVSYHAKRDEIVIQVDEERWQTKSSLFGPMTFHYQGADYLLSEKITGRFALLRGADVVAEGQYRFRSVTIPTYPPDMELFLSRLALGLLIRTVFWELAF